MRRLYYLMLCAMMMSLCLCGCDTGKGGNGEGKSTFTSSTDSCLARFAKARDNQNASRYAKAITDYKRCLAMTSKPSEENETDTLVTTVINATLQLMNSYQSMAMLMSVPPVSTASSPTLHPSSVNFACATFLRQRPMPTRAPTTASRTP